MTYIKNLTAGDHFQMEDSASDYFYIVEGVRSDLGVTVVSYRLSTEDGPMGRYVMHKPSLTSVKVIN